jgi:hypothetical protein
VVGTQASATPLLRCFRVITRIAYESVRARYTANQANMAAGNLAAVISSLTPEEQESVKQFVDFLRRKWPSPSSPFLAAGCKKRILGHPNSSDKFLRALG